MTEGSNRKNTMRTAAIYGIESCWWIELNYATAFGFGEFQTLVLEVGFGWAHRWLKWRKNAPEKEFYRIEGSAGSPKMMMLAKRGIHTNLRLYLRWRHRSHGQIACLRTPRAPSNYFSLILHKKETQQAPLLFSLLFAQKSSRMGLKKRWFLPHGNGIGSPMQEYMIEVMEFKTVIPKAARKKVCITSSECAPTD